MGEGGREGGVREGGERGGKGEEREGGKRERERGAGRELARGGGGNRWRGGRWGEREWKRRKDQRCRVGQGWRDTNGARRGSETERTMRQSMHTRNIHYAY